MGAKSKNYYIGFCSPDGKEKEFDCAVPADLKIKYVAAKFGGDLRLISLSPRKKCGRGRKIRAGYGTMKTLFSFGTGNGIAKKLNVILRKLYLFFLFRCVIRSRDNVILYHSYAYTRFIGKYCAVKKKRIVLEVEEVYGYNAVEDKPYLADEIASIKRFQKFILVNDYIAPELGIPEEDRVVSYGVVDPDYEKCERRFDREHIHVLYAGTIDMKKIGAASAVKSAEYLSDRYVLHIAGFGKEEAQKQLAQLIEENNRHEDRCRIEYHGMLKGEPLNALLDSCDIGISTNVMRPNFANNTFPSKIMTYMTHGLKVVSGYADAFRDAKIARNWSFFYSHEPKEIAFAIERAADTEATDDRPVLREVDDALVAFLRAEGFSV